MGRRGRSKEFWMKKQREWSRADVITCPSCGGFVRLRRHVLFTRDPDEPTVTFVEGICHGCLFHIDVPKELLAKILNVIYVIRDTQFVAITYDIAYEQLFVTVSEDV